MLRLRIAAHSVLLASATVQAADVPAKSRPGEAELRLVISRVNEASVRKDLVALRSLMVEEFTWSFGGDGSADQALAEWKSKPKLLSALAAATRGPCEPIGKGVIQCPRNAGVNHRAGFKAIDGNWKLVYFVAGD